WDVMIVTAYLAFSVIDLAILQRHTNDPKKLKKTARVLAYIGLPLAVSLHTVTAWIFGLQISRAWWNTSLMAPLFVVSAVVSGVALVTLLALAAKRWGKFSLPTDTREWLRKFIVTALLIDLFMVACDYVTIYWGNVPASRGELNLVLPGGSWSWVFWGEWIVGGLIPVLFLAVPRFRQMKGSLGIATGLILVGVFCFRIELVIVGFVNPLIQLAPGTALGTYTPSTPSFELVGRYCPTWVEVSIVLGLISLCLAIVTVGYRSLRLNDGRMVGSHDAR
ncbi:MAG: NrfD/PsrC family molybdoenzyme membrane anchor subunit, partial [Acidimicrobiales bacterium]